MGILAHFNVKALRREIAECLIALVALVALTVVSYRWSFNLATATLLYVIVVVLVSRTCGFVSSTVVAIAAALSLAHLAPPAYSFRVDDPLNIVAIIAFLTTSLIIALVVSKLRKMVEEALSSVNRVLIDAEERERARIARELHDDVGQRVALLQIRFDQLQTDIPNPTVETLNTMDDLRKQIEELAADIQTLAHTLHSSKLEYLGLVKTMRSFCNELEHQQKVEVDFRSYDLPSPLPPDVSLSLYRVLQEALQNSAKHSGARQFEVELFGESGAIHLRVRDSGVGFNPEAARNGRGLGLISMQERIKLVKGEFWIDSRPKSGTTIHASVPLSSNRSARAAS